MSENKYFMSEQEREEIWNKLKEKYPIDEQVKFNEFNINDKLQENMELRIKYQELYEHELFIYNQLLDKMDTLKGKRYDFYKFESDRNLYKSEIEQYYLPKDEKILKMKYQLQKQEQVVKFFKLCMESVEKLYWRIKEFTKNDNLG